MTTKRFVASVQYGDLEGTVKADSVLENDAYDWLEDKGLIDENEFILGITMDTRENRGTFKDPVHVSFLLTEPRDRDTVESMVMSSQGPIELRRVRVEMKLEEFISLFKRFNIALSPYGILDKKEYSYTE